MLISLTQLAAMMPYSAKKNREKFILPINLTLQEFKIITPLRIAAFIAQITHESGSLYYVEEIASGKAYDGRADLGNTNKDAISVALSYDSTPGVWWKGHGLIQITGYDNHVACGKALGLDLIHKPTLLCDPVNATRSAGWYWNKYNCNGLADAKLFGAITKAINGGFNGSKERVSNYARCKKVLECF